MQLTYCHDLSKEENIAWAIFRAISMYETKVKGYNSLEIQKAIIDSLSFAVLNANDCSGKNLLFTYALKPHTNIGLIELHLAQLRIKKQFIDKSSQSQKQYLVIYL